MTLLLTRAIAVVTATVAVAAAAAAAAATARYGSAVCCRYGAVQDVEQMIAISDVCIRRVRVLHSQWGVLCACVYVDVRVLSCGFSCQWKTVSHSKQ